MWSSKSKMKQISKPSLSDANEILGFTEGQSNGSEKKLSQDPIWSIQRFKINTKQTHWIRGRNAMKFKRLDVRKSNTATLFFPAVFFLFTLKQEEGLVLSSHKQNNNLKKQIKQEWRKP